MNLPFTPREQGPILFLELNSPHSSINILTRTAAQQINDIFDHLPPTCKLVVFKSSKPYSFINGTELLLTNAIKSAADVQKFTHITRSAYDKVSHSPVPTVAAIQGSCYGCGLEFALRCSYRVASDSYDTHFYMTELKEYWILPLYGATIKLPQLIGLQAAARLLLWGETWRSDQALQAGLIDQVVASENFSSELDHYLQGILGPNQKSTRKSENIDPIYETELRKIAALPPEQQPLHRQCLALMRSGIEDTENSAEAMKNEVDQFAATILGQSSRHATSFFFTRTMARTAGIGTSSIIPEQEVKIRLNKSQTLSPFQQLMLRRKIQHLKIIDTATTHNAAEIELYVERCNEFYPFHVQWGHRPVIDKWPCFYFSGKEELDIVELICSPEEIELLQDKDSKIGPALRSFLIVLHQLGWQLIGPCLAQSAINRLLWRYGDTLKKYAHQSQDVAYTLWMFGFDKPPHEFRRGNHIQNLTNDLLSTLYQEGKYCVKEGLLKHISQFDLIMRSVFGFPLSKGSCSRYLETNVTHGE